MRQDVSGKEITFFEMRIATEDEGAHAHVHVAVELGEHLIRISHDGAGAAAACEADAAPQMWLNVKIGALRTKFILTFHAGALAVLGACFDLGTFFSREFGDEAVGGGTGFGFGFAHDDMRTEAEVDLAPVGGGFFGHDAHGFGDAVFRLRPHEENVAVLGAQILRSRRDATKVEQGTAVLLVGLGGLGGGQADVVEVTFPFKRAVGAP